MTMNNVALLMIMSYSCFLIKADESCSKKLESDLFDDLLSMMLKIKGSDHGKRDGSAKLIPAFGVTLTKAKSLSPNEIVKFDKVWTNIGNGYSTSTGMFTAPRSGVYHVSCTAFTQVDQVLRLHLMKNKDKVVVLYPGTKGYSSGTINMVLQLKKVDTVYIQHPNLSGENYVNTDSNGHTMFSGYFISE